VKRIVMAALLSIFAALPARAQEPPRQKGPAAPPVPVVRCKSVDGRACTSKQVQALSDAVFAEKSHHDVLALFENLTLASSDGTLKCVQNKGTACTTAQLDVVKQIAFGEQLYINYNSSKPPTGN